MVKNEIMWLDRVRTYSCSLAHSLVPSFRICNSQMWFNSSGDQLLNRPDRLLIGFDKNNVYLKLVGEGQGLKVNRRPRQSGKAEYVWMQSAIVIKILKENGIKIPTTAILRKDKDVFVGELPKG
jgi:hypothetical protein